MAEQQQQQQSGGMPGWVNATMKLVLKSPLHGLVSSHIMLITFTGRKSGKVYTTPVSYTPIPDGVMLFTRTVSKWWKNLTEEAQVTLRLRGRDVTGATHVIADDLDTKVEHLVEHLKANRFDARIYNVTFDDGGEPKMDEVRSAAEHVVLVQVKLAGS